MFENFFCNVIKNPLRYQDIPQMKDYIENIVPNMMERDFISHFRLNRRTVGNLVCFMNIFRLLALCYISISLYLQYESWLFFCRESYFYLKLQNGSKKAYELYCIFKLIIQRAKLIGNRAAGCEFGIDECYFRRWRMEK